MTASESNGKPRDGVEGLVEAFTGLAAAVIQVLPSLAEETRHKLEPHLAQAKMLGELSVTYGSYELRRKAKELIDALASTHNDERATASEGQKPTRDIDEVIPGYDDLTAADIVQQLDALTVEQLDVVLAHEEANRARTTVLHRAGQLRKAASAG